MSQDVRKSDVLTPTASSVAVCIAGFATALFLIVLPRLGGDTVLGLLFGKDASESLIVSSKDNYGPLLEQLLNNDLVGRAVVFGVWMFVGLCTFILMTFVMEVFRGVREESREMGYVHQNKELHIRNDVISILFKLTIAALWAGFLVICIRYVLSYFAVTGFVALGAGGPSDWGIFLVACAILALAIHVQIVFARLIVGRTRVFE